MTADGDLALCLAELGRRGVLLELDSALPSVATLVAGAPVRTLLRKHPARDRVAAASAATADHPDVLALRFVCLKRTFVHRALWPEILAVAAARDPWQTELLPASERTLLEIVDARGEVEIDDVLGAELEASTSHLGRTLEGRLLVLGVSSPTSRRRLVAWSRWIDRHGDPLRAAIRRRAPGARDRLDRVARALGPKAWLPWWDVARRRSG